MLNFFDTLIGYIELFVQYILNFFQTLISLVTVLIRAVAIPQQLVFVAPSVIAASITTVLAVSVGKLLIWGSNK